LRSGHKLHTAAEFERVRRARERLTDDLFVVQCVKNEKREARLGMAVGIRAAGNAVGRNRLRRLIRESFRMHRQEMPAVDVLVTARAAAVKAGNRAILESLVQHWRAIGRPA
jgi:ribonuclease P protein component